MELKDYLLSEIEIRRDRFKENSPFFNGDYEAGAIQALRKTLWEYYPDMKIEGAY